MALPQDGQDANGLTKVTQIPAGKELMFIDPTTNEGGIITLEDLTKQILNGLASQAFALDAGQMTLLAALNKLNSESFHEFNGNIDLLSDHYFVCRKEESMLKGTSQGVFYYGFLSGKEEKPNDI